MTETMSNAEQIARSLTEAQREAVAHPESAHGFWCADGRTAKALQRRGLIGTLDFAGRAAWMPLGLAVREILRRQA